MSVMVSPSVRSYRCSPSASSPTIGDGSRCHRHGERDAHCIQVHRGGAREVAGGDVLHEGGHQQICSRRWMAVASICHQEPTGRYSAAAVTWRTANGSASSTRVCSEYMQPQQVELHFSYCNCNYMCNILQLILLILENVFVHVVVA
jgi:hypothetical protein